ncbi:DUF2461 domain-containing protein [Bittarella massiliensis]|uniref:DUF2461 domain-containing protein n=1 Tax=Bittarella massiliensis (ex Durand et al. 2017) TaxID=1720313 RepID=UPI00163BE056|nr:DUF2461 domain-containing protein [Bittarella massiliensis (ex Durand et al. 2017)]MBC2869996.1 DUF2461 domain-containing protein [Bittarella massiliensis (ex Durand et al. 2017)]
MRMEEMLSFLRELEEHNDRDWFHAHEEGYRQATAAFEQLVGELNLALHQGDPEIPLAAPKTLTFKLMRDTRFSRDKSPYNPSFRAHIGPKGKLPVPVGYYLFLRPGGRSFLGGGLFADMFRDATTLVRDAIAAQGERWEEILAAPDFRAHFTVGGSALKNVPRGYDPDHPQAQYLKNKSWYLEYPLGDEQLLAPDFVDFAAALFLKMRPFGAFLNEALAPFEMPSR